MKYRHRRLLTAVPLFLLRTIVVGVETTAERVVNWADLQWHRLRWWEEAPIRAALRRRGVVTTDTLVGGVVDPNQIGPVYALDVQKTANGSVHDYSRVLGDDEGWPDDAELYPAESCEDHGALDCKTCDPDSDRNEP